MTPSSDGTKKTRLIGGGRQAEGAGGAFSRRWLTQQPSREARNQGGRVPILQMSNLRPQEGRWLPQGHPCSQQMMRPTLLCPLLPRNQMCPSRGSRAWLFLPREGETLGTPPPFPLPLLLPDCQCPQGGNHSRGVLGIQTCLISRVFSVLHSESEAGGGARKGQSKAWPAGPCLHLGSGR